MSHFRLALARDLANQRKGSFKILPLKECPQRGSGELGRPAMLRVWHGLLLQRVETGAFVVAPLVGSLSLTVWQPTEQNTNVIVHSSRVLVYPWWVPRCRWLEPIYIIAVPPHWIQAVYAESLDIPYPIKPGGCQ